MRKIILGGLALVLFLSGCQTSGDLREPKFCSEEIYSDRNLRVALDEDYSNGEKLQEKLRMYRDILNLIKGLSY
jgi:hypothetical protein